ncbi:hypothetical protein H6A12_04935 [Phocea massiliensis]|uniref:Uncharacterized protein n=1 Tax=Merdimmobilis hominis TaxID=2897707 RepID=A0A939BDQ8_9FIRM|nr:hypothetical protein [Merdimmobilis hominis]MBM6920500.1 hypothetical protein [Merdimmobilis hominis]
MNFAKNTYLASIDYVTSLFAATDRDGALRMPKNFGTDEEQDDEFDIFKMSWNRDDLNMLLSEFQELYAGLSEIAKVYDKLDNNPELVRDALDNPVLFDIWQLYLQRPQWYGEEERILDAALKKEAQAEELSAEEERLLEKYRGEELLESVKNLGGNCFAYDVHIHALRLCELMSIGAPKIIIEHEARCLIGCMALKDYAVM